MLLLSVCSSSMRECLCYCVLLCGDMWYILHSMLGMFQTYILGCFALFVGNCIYFGVMTTLFFKVLCYFVLLLQYFISLVKKTLFFTFSNVLCYTGTDGLRVLTCNFFVLNFPIDFMFLYLVDHEIGGVYYKF